MSRSGNCGSLVFWIPIWISAVRGRGRSAHRPAPKPPHGNPRGLLIRPPRELLCLGWGRGGYGEARGLNAGERTSSLFIQRSSCDENTLARNLTVCIGSGHLTGCMRTVLCLTQGGGLGEAGSVVLLNGHLGAGKSTISRGFVRAACRDQV